MATARSSPASRPATLRAARTAKTSNKKTKKTKPTKNTHRAKAWREHAGVAPAVSRCDGAVDPPATISRAVMAGRVRDMVAREIEAVERVLDVLAPEGPGDAERAARTLASIARTLRELSLMNDTGEQPEAATADDDDSPRDLDEFRRELARRINAFVDERTGAGLPVDADAERDPAPRA
jgi:hypothetical protein